MQTLSSCEERSCALDVIISLFPKYHSRHLDSPSVIVHCDAGPPFPTPRRVGDTGRRAPNGPSTSSCSPSQTVGGQHLHPTSTLMYLLLQAAVCCRPHLAGDGGYPYHPPTPSLGAGVGAGVGAGQKFGEYLCHSASCCFFMYSTLMCTPLSGDRQPPLPISHSSCTKYTGQRIDRRNWCKHLLGSCLFW